MPSKERVECEGTAHEGVPSSLSSTAKAEVLPVAQRLVKDEDADVRFFSDQACSQITSVLSG